MQRLDSSLRCVFRIQIRAYAQSLASALLVLGVLPASLALAKPAPKVEICHIPPGNPANAHTIKVSGNAIKAHLKHGDYIGPCEPLCEESCDDGNALKRARSYPPDTGGRAVRKN